MSDKVAIAQARSLEIFDSGYSCAESVLQGLQESWGLEGAHLRNAAAGFGGGIGRCGSTCGAITGAVMAMGLAEGNKTDQEGEVRDRVRGRVQRLFDSFQETFGSVDCRQLTGYEIRTPVQYQTFHESEVRKRVCQEAIKLVIRMALE